MIELPDDRLRSINKRSVNNFNQLPKGQRYQIAFSGGKDSRALLTIYAIYLNRRFEPLDMVVAFSDTHLETRKRKYGFKSFL